MNQEKFENLSLKEKLDYIIGNVANKVGDGAVMSLISGGKDSTLALAIAKEAGLDVKKMVNYTHRWTWEIYKNQIETLSERYGVPVDFVDITDKIARPTPDGLFGWIGIPCKFCKKSIFTEVYDRAIAEGCTVVMSGYNAMDSVSGEIRKHVETEEDLDITDMEFNTYSRYANHPEIAELRPLIRLTDNEILAALKLYGLKVQRTHEANPQFTYWREGCPMQYIDRDVPITEELLDQSVRINGMVTKYARDRGIRASVLVPSFTVITFPSGHEKEIEDLLKNE